MGEDGRGGEDGVGRMVRWWGRGGVRWGEEKDMKAVRRLLGFAKFETMTLLCFIFKEGI